MSSTTKASPVAEKAVGTGEGLLTEPSRAEVKSAFGGFALRKEAVAR